MNLRQAKFTALVKTTVFFFQLCVTSAEHSHNVSLSDQVIANVTPYGNRIIKIWIPDNCLNNAVPEGPVL